MEVDEELRAKRQLEKQAAKAAGLVKRKVGMHLGYVGTDYSGLQFSALEHVKTIENVLLKALCSSGCVTESNAVSLSKINWSRSSRTDKGVHSLATVVAMKCLVDEKMFDSDPEGLELAVKISEHLPPEIRVLSVQRVNDGFFARKACMSRTYSYYVPLSLLTENGEMEEGECVERFRTALQIFCGRHAFHNYTKRKQYIDDHDSWSYGKRSRQKRRLMEEEDEDEDAEGDVPSLEESAETTPFDYEALLQRERETGRWRFWNLEFKEMNDPSDRVVAPHYRFILSFTVDDPAPVIPGGVRAVRCEVKGHSFMLHQIRYMIGTGVAAAKKLISLSVVESSLKACIRINLPLALPQPLVLVDNAFATFPSNKGQVSVVSKWSGERLQLRDGGAKLQKRFHEEVMLPEINRLLQLPDWERWAEVLKLVTYDESLHPDVQDVMQKYQDWVKEKQQQQEAKREALAQELAARGIDRETWMEERRQQTRENKKLRRKGRN